ncbi:hypothetical protein [Streptomyces sp. NPDC096013]|uniref:hypothetical protein n=1 Tax=Streptomyces sp. NPDC096013 TaxID=3366069 RepID=UPI003803C8AA
MLEVFPPAEETSVVSYVIYEDGTAGRIEVTAGAVPELPRPGTMVTEEVYQAKVAALEEQAAKAVADLEAAEQRRAHGDFTALTLLGLTEETARRLSGYTGPHIHLPVVGES